MLGSLFRAVLVLVVLVAVVVGAAAFFLGYRLTDLRRDEPATIGTSGREAGGTASGTARERGAEIGERVGAMADRAGEALSDGSITAKIKSKMALDDTIEARHINVTTRDKVVTLTGTVGSAAERQRAVQLAKETDGVKSVTDQLRLAR